MSIQTPGSFLVCIMVARSPGTNVSTWITYFIGGLLQGILLALCVYYTYFNHAHENVLIIHSSLDESNCDALALSDQSSGCK